MSLFLRFLFFVDRDIEFELGSCGSVGGGGSFVRRGGDGKRGGGSGLNSSIRGGDREGCEEGGEKEVISSDGDLFLRPPEDECELGDGVSSGGGGGGGSTNSNVRDAIWICDLSTTVSLVLATHFILTHTARREVPCFRCRTIHRRPKRRCAQ